MGTDGKAQAGAAEAQDSMWMEIIRHMEAIYAQLAEAQQEAERRALELEQAKALADNVLRSMHDALVVLDPEGRISLVNDATERLFGYPRDQLLGQPLEVLVPEDQRPRWRWPLLRRRLQREGGLAEREATWLDRRGGRIAVGVSGALMKGQMGEPGGAVLVVRDLRETKRRIAVVRAATRAARARAAELQRTNAELRQLQEQLVQAAKMSSLGRLAAGVAHELNNPLGSILLYADLVLEDTPADDPRRGNIEKIVQQAERCRQIVRGLLEFGRPSEGTPRPTDVNALLRETFAMLEGQELFHNVQVRWQLAENLPRISADPARLRQAFTNVIINAAEAMGGGGTLTIRTEPAPLGAVRVSISDTGCGIAPEQKERLFEPFYTTKQQGTGLGLAITYGIVRQHGGEIEVDSEPGRGTTFCILLRSFVEAPSDAG